MEYKLLTAAGRPAYFSITSRELQEVHARILGMTGEELRAGVAEVLHYACIVGWLRGLSAEQLVSDVGVVHGLVHVLRDIDGPGELDLVREQLAALPPPTDHEVAAFLEATGARLTAEEESRHDK